MHLHGREHRRFKSLENEGVCRYADSYRWISGLVASEEVFVPESIKHTKNGISVDFAGASTKKHEELRLLINSRNPIISVESEEEERFTRLLVNVAADLGVSLYVWSVTVGLAKWGGAALYNSDQPEQALTNIATIHESGIFLLKDFSRYCDNDRISRRLRDLADGFRTDRRSIVILAASIQLPKELESDAATFQLGLPICGGTPSGRKKCPCGIEPRARLCNGPRCSWHEPSRKESDGFA